MALPTIYATPATEVFTRNADLFTKVRVRPGDHILVLPKIDVKSRQIAKEITQMLFQFALMAGVVTNLF